MKKELSAGKKNLVDHTGRGSNVVAVNRQNRMLEAKAKAGTCK